VMIDKENKQIALVLVLTIVYLVLNALALYGLLGMVTKIILAKKFAQFMVISIIYYYKKFNNGKL